MMHLYKVYIDGENEMVEVNDSLDLDNSIIRLNRESAFSDDLYKILGINREYYAPIDLDFQIPLWRN